MTPPASPAARTLVVGGQPGAGTFPRIADAMTAARAGDTVQLEPGVYREQVAVRDGVDLVARVPGTVTLARGDTATVEWVGVTADGSLNGRIAGIRIESTRESPVDVGIRVAGQGRTIELLELRGPMRSGIELRAPGAVTIQGSFLAVQGTAVSMAEGSQATIANNVFFRTGQPAAALSLTGAARPALTRNIFAGFGVDIVKGLPAEQRRGLLDGNYVLASEPRPAR
jgi:hypothetical protein